MRIGVDRREEAPGDTVDGWEDVVEFTCRAEEPGVVAAGMWAEAPGPEFALDPPGAEWFRLRVHARNRDLEYDGVATEPREEYLLVSWPSEPADPVVLAAGSQLARQRMAAPPRPVRPARRPAAGGAITVLPGFPESAADAAARAKAEANLLRIERERRQR